MSSPRTLSLWTSAILLVAIPMMLAVDFGGIYHWSQYVAAIGILVAAGLAVPGLSDSTASSGVRQHAILLPLGVLLLWAWVQSASLPAGLVAWLSPGSHAAYTQWLDGFPPATVESSDGGATHVSVSPFDTAHVAAILALLLTLCWAASITFHSRSRLKMLLSGIALAGASVAILGLYRKLDPDAELWIFQPRPSAFGGFVNRNNAALMLNFGLAASLGLLSWRMMALYQVEMDAPDFEFNDFIALVSDRESMIGLISGMTCMGGLLINGSRGGLVAALFGMALAFGYVRPRRGLISIPFLIVLMGISVLILIIPMNLNLESLQRWEVISPTADTLQNDGRLLHWQDGWRAAIAYFPGGSGLSSYAYAYLPYQHFSPSSWYEHADNLWLEMLVELGVVGLIVFGWLLVLLLIALSRLSVSVDPLDQGLRVAGWYAIGAIITSQFFDYGLVLPANLIAALLLGTAIISRDIANGGGANPYFSLDIGERSGRLPTPSAPRVHLRTDQVAWKSKRCGSSRHILPILLSITMIGLALFALPRLRQDAITDSLLSRLNSEYSQWRLNPDSLSKIEDALRQRDAVGSSPLLMARLSTVQRDRGHLAEVREWRPQSPVEMREVFRQTNLQNRIRPYPPEASVRRRTSLESWKHYSDAWNTSLATLQICPLAQEPRGSLLRLSPIIESDAESSPTRSPNHDVAHAAAKQLLLFYNGNSERQFALGQASLHRGDAKAAAKGLRSALVADPSLAPTVMALLRETSELKIADVIPDDSRVMQLAAAQNLRWEHPDVSFLRHAAQMIHCDDDEPLEDQAACQALLGRLYFQLEELTEAQEHYQQAIRMEPDQASHRAEFIDRLLERQLNAEALKQARLGRNALPDDPRFQKVIDQIAELQRTRRVPSANGPQVDRSKLDALLEETNR